VGFSSTAIFLNHNPLLSLFFHNPCGRFFYCASATKPKPFSWKALEKLVTPYFPSGKQKKKFMKEISCLNAGHLWLWRIANWENEEMS
jgi:hypothetical protein